MMQAIQSGDVIGRSTQSLITHLRRIDVFRLGVLNSFGIDLRRVGRSTREHGQLGDVQRFHFLPEVLPFLEPKARLLSADQRRAFETLKDQALDSFWVLFADFSCLSDAIAKRAGLDENELDCVLGRTLLLFDPGRKTKFITYLEKSLRESVKNIRGRHYAEQLGLPVSAGRLVPQLLWLLDQASLRIGRELSTEETEETIIAFLTQHRSKFSDGMMRRIAEVLRSGRRQISLDPHAAFTDGLPADGRPHSPSAGDDCWLDEVDEYRWQLKQIHDAAERARMNAGETALVLSHLDLPFDQEAYERLAGRTTAAALRKRTTRLLIRLSASRYATEAPRCGHLLHQTAMPAHETIRELLRNIGGVGRHFATVVDELLNWMTLSDSVYRISITERGQLYDYLCGQQPPRINAATFWKLKAALIEQDRSGFPCFETY